MREWIVAYLLTCLVEIPVVVLMTRSAGWRSRRFPGALPLAWLLQLTHPLLWLVAPQSPLQLIAAEAAVTAVEAVALWWWAIARAGAARVALTGVRALLISLIANAASLLVGLAASLIALR